MPLDTLELINRYAMYGVKHWRDAPSTTKTKAGQALVNKIADNDAVASMTVYGNLQDGPWYIPMPPVNHSGIDWCFFLPIHISENQMAFDLFLVIDDANSLGFRFEPADSDKFSHNYSHVQMNRKMNMKQFNTIGIPKWIPDSYPAFAIRTSTPLDMFLSMATSVHGYHGGITNIVKDILKDRPNDIRKCLEKLNTMLA